jgi:hypothetical protein
LVYLLDIIAGIMAQINQADFGINWWIDPQVVVKADIQIQNVGTAIDNEYSGLNIGLGYAF